MNVLIAVDLQKDFIDGALGTAEAVAMLPAAQKRIAEFEGKVIFTRDTHAEDYMTTREGGMLPVPHCIKGTDGWQIADCLQPYITAETEIIDKPTFGSAELGLRLAMLHQQEPIEHITLIGLCTDICVISNAMLIRAFLPEVPISIDAACCAGVSPETHNNALAAMSVCQMLIENA